MISRAYVGLGSNLGDRSGFLLLGIMALLDSGLPVSRLSRIYETEPLDVLDQPNFLNMVVELRGVLPEPAQLMARLLRIEDGLGRTRTVSRGPRTLDMDLLLYEDKRSDTELLTLPHPRLHLRRFVLAPLAELAPGLVHPVLQRSVRDLYDTLNDAAIVRVWNPAGEQT
jgi:2-amino-4-hydroxy-6-hydroxymethyldihydropteridine diphosphokinase